MLLLQLAICVTVIVNVIPLNIQKRSAYGSVPEEEDETPQVPQTQFGSAPAETFSPVVSAPRHPIPVPQDKTFTELTHQQPQRAQPGPFGPGPEAPRVSQQTFPQYQPQQPSFQPQTQQTFPQPQPQPQPQRPQAGTYFSGQPQQPRPQQFPQTYQQPQTFPGPQPGRTSFGGTVPDAGPVSAPIFSSFTCDNRPYGYYADEENNCDVYHHCNPITNSDGTVVYQKYSHWCSPGTKFSQGHLVCVHPNEAVECRLSANYYSVNDKFNEIGGTYQSGRQSGGQPYRPSYSQQPATPNRGSYTGGQQHQQPLSNTFPQTGLSFSSGPAHQPSAPSRPQTGSFVGGAPGHHDDGPVISGY